MRPQHRATTDPGGRIVDVYPSGLTLEVIAVPAETVTDDLLRSVVLDILRSIREIPSAQLRERDFPIFICKWEVYGKQLAGIGLPKRFAVHLYHLFQERLRAVTVIEDSGRSSVIDVGAEPFAFYEHGKLVIYVDPFAVADEGVYGTDIELRSAEFAATRASAERRLPLLRVRDSGPSRHSIQTWEDLRLDVLRFIWETLDPGTFTSLRRAVTEQFGISIRLGSTAAAGRHGSISIGWLSADDRASEVSILVNKELPGELKYVVLAHELAHYVLHFPLVLAGQLIEQLSWLNPLFEYWYMAQFRQTFGNNQSLEAQANALGSYLLIPPQYSLEKMSAMILEGATPYSADELAWRFLAQFFPERSSVDYSWYNMNEMRKQAKRELAWARSLNTLNVETLYGLMLSATLERGSASSKESTSAIVDAILEFWNYVMEYLGSGAQPVCYDTEAHGTVQLDAADDSRQILAPVNGERTDARRLPLVPSGTKRPFVRWRSVLNPSAQPRTIDEWRARYPSWAVTLYPNRRAPSKPVLGIHEEDANE